MPIGHLEVTKCFIFPLVTQDSSVDDIILRPSKVVKQRGPQGHGISTGVAHSKCLKWEGIE